MLYGGQLRLTFCTYVYIAIVNTRIALFIIERSQCDVLIQAQERVEVVYQIASGVLSPLFYFIYEKQSFRSIRWCLHYLVVCRIFKNDLGQFHRNYYENKNRWKSKAYFKCLGLFSILPVVKCKIFIYFSSSHQ